jgi:transposase
MGTARRQFTDEFKREAVGLLASRGRPLNQIAQELGIAAARLRAWRNRGDWGPPFGGLRRIAARSNTQAAIPPAGMDLAADNARPRGAKERLRMEPEILKKRGGGSAWGGETVAGIFYRGGGAADCAACPNMDSCAPASIQKARPPRFVPICASGSGSWTLPLRISSTCKRR